MDQLLIFLSEPPQPVLCLGHGARLPLVLLLELLQLVEGPKAQLAQLRRVLLLLLQGHGVLVQHCLDLSGKTCGNFWGKKKEKTWLFCGDIIKKKI